MTDLLRNGFAENIGRGPEGLVDPVRSTWNAKNLQENEQNPFKEDGWINSHRLCWSLALPRRIAKNMWAPFLWCSQEPSKSLLIIHQQTNLGWIVIMLTFSLRDGWVSPKPIPDESSSDAWHHHLERVHQVSTFVAMYCIWPQDIAKIRRVHNTEASLNSYTLYLQDHSLKVHMHKIL